MNYIDFHCDTLMKMYDYRKAGTIGPTPWKNDCQIDLSRECESGYLAQFFACYIWWVDRPLLNSHFEDALAMADILKDNVKEHADKVAFAGSWADYQANKKAGKVSTFLTVEEGGILENDITRLDTLYEKGIRLITLVWNYDTCLGFPSAFGYPKTTDQFQDHGLKPFGFETVERMNELDMIVDVSHLSDAGFYDVYNHSTKPFIASHSNSRAMCNHPRNMTDDMIKKLAEKGGVMGLNFCGNFLDDKNHKSTTEAMIRHVKHIIDVGGHDVLAIGTDFDGIEDDLEIAGCQEIGKLRDALSANGISDEDIEKICFKNAEAFLQRVL